MRKILLDENLPRPLAKEFSDKFKIKTVSEMGWANKKNGALLKAMIEENFDILVTVDKNLRYQQNLDKYEIKVVVLRTYDNRFKTIKEHVLKIEEEILNSPDSEKVLEIDLR